MILLYCLIGSIFFIFLDELIMGCSQRRIGPLNLGWYGILASLINGCNLCISQFLVPKVNVHFGFQAFPIFFFLFSFWNYIILYPFFLIDIYVSIILILLLTGISILFILFSAFSGCSKYSILGSIRIISQFISFELMFTTILLIFIWSWNFNDLSIASMWFTGLIGKELDDLELIKGISEARSVNPVFLLFFFLLIFILYFVGLLILFFWYLYSLIDPLIQWFFLVVFSIHYFLYVFYSQLATLRFALLRWLNVGFDSIRFVVWMVDSVINVMISYLLVIN